MELLGNASVNVNREIILPLFLIHTAVSFASFFLTTLVERRLNAALLGACSTEKMQDYPLRVLGERRVRGLSISCGPESLLP